MLTKNEKKLDQLQAVSIDMLVPEDHLLRKIDKAIDFSFIYDLVEEKYSTETGRPSIDPVMLIKIPLIQYMFGIKSMRQTIKEIEVNMNKRKFGKSSINSLKSIYYMINVILSIFISSIKRY